MMGWLAMIGLAVPTALGLGFFLRRDKGALQFMGAALLLSGWILATVPTVLAGLFLYCRVLGRFAWWLAESLPEEQAEAEPRYKRFQ